MNPILLAPIAVMGAVGYGISRIFAALRDKGFRAAAKTLGAKLVSERSGGFTMRKKSLTIHFGYRQPGNNDDGRTWVEVASPSFPLLLRLRREVDGLRDKKWKYGLMDIKAGDPAFDDVWMVEGAPVERCVRLLSDPTLRAELTAFAAHRDPYVEIDEGSVNLAKDRSDYAMGNVQLGTIRLALMLAHAAVAEGKKPSPTADDADQEEIRALRKHRESSLLDKVERFFGH